MSERGGRVAGMVDERTPKRILRDYLQEARDAVVWKMNGLSDYDVRRPLTPTGTNLLGIVKHLATLEIGYFCLTFGRRTGESLPWFSAEAEPNADMYATADESRAEIVDLYRRAWSHADGTFDALDLETPGSVPWWTPGNAPTLHQILVHMIAETHRHAGHADIVRELIDGEAGMAANDSNLPAVDEAFWPDYRDRLEAIARQS
jgi:hypothetical protein